MGTGVEVGSVFWAGVGVAFGVGTGAGAGPCAAEGGGREVGGAPFVGEIAAEAAAARASLERFV